MKNFILTFILFIAFNSNAQECGTPISTTNQVFNIPTNNDAQYCVNVKFHIVRESNGTGGFNASQIPSLINYINQFYNSISINVASAGFDYINNSVLFNIDDVGNDSTEFNQLITNNNVSNAINFYIVNSANYNGRAGAIISNNLVVRIDKVFAPTSPHEIGHCFNLLHTFQGTASGTGGCAENINGSNCSSCGDNVCDTPADANLGATGGYNPDLTNIMSYYFTRDHFTQLQGTRMRNAIVGSSILQQTLSSQCASISGVANICGVSNNSYTLVNPQNTNVVWSVTPNIQILSSSNTGIVIKAITATTNGEAIITANFNGLIITKYIWIGIPSFDIVIANTGGGRMDLELKGINATSSGIIDSNIITQNITNVVWQIVSTNPSNCGTLFPLGRTARLLYSSSTCRTQLKVTATNSCGSKIVYRPFIGSGGGLERISSTTSDEFSIYPNPTKDIINIELKDINNLSNNEVKGELFDLMGISKYKLKIIDNKANFSVRELSKGIYVLKISKKDKTESHQVIIE